MSQVLQCALYSKLFELDTKSSMDENELPDDPMMLFSQWLSEVGRIKLIIEFPKLYLHRRQYKKRSLNQMPCV